MFAISVEASFKASHSLGLADGSKEPSHQHNWVVSARVESESLDGSGTVMDFHGLKQLLSGITDELDGTDLGQIQYFKLNGCSAEVIAKYVYEKLEKLLPVRVSLSEVKTAESAGFAAKFSG